MDASLAAPVPTRLQEIRERLVRLEARNAELRVSIQQLTRQVEADRREVELGEEALARLIEEEREMDKRAHVSRE